MTRAEYVERGYADMSRAQTWRLSECPLEGWQRAARGRR